MKVGYTEVNLMRSYRNCATGPYGTYAWSLLSCRSLIRSSIHTTPCLTLCAVKAIFRLAIAKSPSARLASLLLFHRKSDNVSKHMQDYVHSKLDLRLQVLPAKSTTPHPWCCLKQIHTSYHYTSMTYSNCEYKSIFTIVL